MGDSIAEELVQLLRGINATLTVKLSHLLEFVFRNKNASSIGAAAGLAIALWWTWKCWRIPGTRASPRLEKRDRGSTSQAPGAGSMDSGNGSSTAVATSVTHATQRGSVVESKGGETGVLTTAQVVRRQLNGGRKMTCQLLVVRPAVVEVLLEIARTCDLYLVARVVDDASEGVVMAALDAVGLFSDAKLSREKVLFCSTETGRTSFVRQLEPDWHVDTLRDINAGLAPFVRQQLHVSPPGASPIAPNVYIVESLDQYFSGAFCS
jgi:hypothetical protein